MTGNCLRVGFFLDGYTLKKVNEYYRVHHRYHASLDLRGLKFWVQLQIQRYFNRANRVVALESHYYHPQRNPHIYARGVKGVFKFEFELMNAGYQVHYSDLPVDDGHMGPNLGLIKDAEMFAAYCDMDAVVLLSTQGQYVPLVDRLKKMGVPVLLLGWSFSYPKNSRYVHWRTDTGLRLRCAHYVAMERILDHDPANDIPPTGFFFRPQVGTAPDVAVGGGDLTCVTDDGLAVGCFADDGLAGMKKAQGPNDLWAKCETPESIKACFPALSASRCGRSM